MWKETIVVWRLLFFSHCHVRLFATPWTAAHQAPPSMGFSRQEHWSGVPLPWMSRLQIESAPVAVEPV